MERLREIRDGPLPIGTLLRVGPARNVVRILRTRTGEHSTVHDPGTQSGDRPSFLPILRQPRRPQQRQSLQIVHGTAASSGKQYLGEKQSGVPQTFRFVSWLQPSSQSRQRAIQSFLVKLRGRWRLASTAAERHREQPLANHISCGEFGNRRLAVHGRFHQPRLRQRLAQISPCIPQLAARFSRGGTSGRVGKRTVANPSHEPSNDGDGANVPATGVRAEYMADDTFDPPQRLCGPEHLDRNAGQQAFEAVFGPGVEFICKAGSVVVNEYGVVRAFVAGGHEAPANDLRRLIPLRDCQNRARTRVQRFPSNSAGSNDWQEPMPSPDRDQALLDHVRGGDRSEQPPRRVLVDPVDRFGEGARQQREQQVFA